MDRLLREAGGCSSWRAAEPSLLVRQEALTQEGRCRVAGFDLNDTLVSSKIGAPGYQVTTADWMFYNEVVPQKLKELHAQGFKLVIFTNQGNIRSALEGKRALAFKAYVDAFLQAVAVPMLVLAATQRDRFRKPCRGMWDHLEQKGNACVAINLSESFYVGDAAGGEGEHSADDADFAKAVGLRFIHARDFFRSSSGNLHKQRLLKANDEERQSKVAKTSQAGFASLQEKGLSAGKILTSGRPKPPLVLVLVGLPGCGKSTLADRLGPPAPAGPRASAKANGGGLGERAAVPWRRVCQDLLGSKGACLRAASNCLKEGLSVIIDRTNVSVEQRAPWLTLARENGAVCHCILFNRPLEDCILRAQQRLSHEGGLTGAAARPVVQKLYAMLEPVVGEEAQAFERVRVVHTDEDCEDELRHYNAEGQVASAPAPSAPAVTPTPGLPAPASNAASDSTDRKVEMLVAMAFPEEACRAALKAAAGDTNVAANRLLADRLID